MSEKKVVVFGAGGVVGQHMMKHKPEWASAVFTRTQEYKKYTMFDANTDSVFDFLNFYKPDVIINLAGQNVVDIVENDHEKYMGINIEMPLNISIWSEKNKKRFIQVSTQGIFSGENAPYSPSSKANPVSWYGRQKLSAESIAIISENSEVVRLTFVIGVRPDQKIGRVNPLEQMLVNKKQLQVNDRFFSPVFAFDAAQVLWERVLIESSDGDKIIHVGNPITCSRYSLVQDLIKASDGELNIDLQPVSYRHFSSDVVRPKDTTWEQKTAVYRTEYFEGLRKCYLEWKELQDER